jgi:hypothetical protein
VSGEVWTTEPPTEAGEYWVKKGDREEIGTFQVMADLSFYCHVLSTSDSWKRLASKGYARSILPVLRASDYALLAARVGELEREAAARALELAGFKELMPEYQKKDRLWREAERRVGELERQLSFVDKIGQDAALTLANLHARNDALKATLAQHREALAPFAVIAEAADAKLAAAGLEAKYDNGKIPVPLGDCRRARSVMEAG